MVSVAMVTKQMEALDKPKRTVMPMRSDERLALKIANDVLRRYPVSSVLDIGCGGGLLAEPIARLGAKVTGIDASEGAIMAAKAHAEQQNLDIDYLLTSSEDMTREAKNRARFDFIYASEVIEHVTDRPAFIAAMAAMLKPDGIVAITTINKSLPALLLAKFAAEYIVRIVPAGTHQFNQFVSPQTLQNECAVSGILIDDVTGFVPDLKGGFKFATVTAINYGISGQLF